MTGPRPAGRPWTRVEDDQLRAMLEAGMTAPRGRTKDKTHSVSGSLAKSCPGQTRSGAEGEGKMTCDSLWPR